MTEKLPEAHTRFDIKDGETVCLEAFCNPIVSAIAFGREIAGQVTLDHV